MDVNKGVITRVYAKITFIYSKFIALNIYFSTSKRINTKRYSIKNHFVICYFYFSISCSYSRFKIFKFKICICQCYI